MANLPGFVVISPFASIDRSIAGKTKDQVMHVPVGTPYSIAPECLSGAYTVQCDLWSVGVLTFTLLTGQPPFTGRCVCVCV